MNSKKKNIIWLASYPKSGNTWLRVFLENINKDSNHPFDINKLESGHLFSSRSMFDMLSGIASSDLGFEETDVIRREVLEHYSTTLSEPAYIKIHDSFSAAVPAGVVIYIVRNPLDVAVSYSHHSSVDVETVIKGMCNDDAVVCAHTERLDIQLCQRLGSWSSHVASWVNNPDANVHVMRYEDMKHDTFNTFSKALYHIGLECSDEQIMKAIRFSSFDEMKKQETTHGFRERSVKAANFFRKGTVGTWRNELTNAQKKNIIHSNKEVMKKYGYIDDNNNPL